MSDPHETHSVQTLSVDKPKFVKFLIPFIVFIFFASILFSSQTFSTNEETDFATENTNIIDCTKLNFVKGQASIFLNINQEKIVYLGKANVKVQIFGTAKVNNVCTIRDDKVIEGKIPKIKESYTIKPLTEVNLLISKL